MTRKVPWPPKSLAIMHIHQKVFRTLCTVEFAARSVLPGGAVISRTPNGTRYNIIFSIKCFKTPNISVDNLLCFKGYRLFMKNDALFRSIFISVPNYYPPVSVGFGCV